MESFLRARGGSKAAAADAAKGKSSRRAVGVLSDEDLDELGQFRLLAARQPQGILKHQAELSTRSNDTLGPGFAQQLMHGDAERLGHRQQHVGTRQVAALFPIADVRLVLADLPGQFPLRKAGGFAQSFET
jgi:hypothetical protein